MSVGKTLRPSRQIREHTRSEHERSERVLEERFFPDGEVGRRGFEEMLVAFLGLYRGLDHRLLHATRRFLDPFTYRPRTPRLKHDLRVLGRSEAELAVLPTAPLDEILPLDGVQALLGCLYVVEGSELGGRVIWKQLTGSLPPEALRADAFFGGDAERTRARWNRFRRVFDRRIDPGPPLEEAVETARATFRTYREWMR